MGRPAATAAGYFRNVSRLLLLLLLQLLLMELREPPRHATRHLLVSQTDGGIHGIWLLLLMMTATLFG
jgi:hypothetical protein